ncbi:MAG: hypothetical protein ABI863_22835 [Ginsengibacter sp.]
MKKNYLAIAAVFLQIFHAMTSVAQESNLKEDYSAYLPEIRAVNKFISQSPF